MKTGKRNHWKGVARILGITFFFSSIAGQGVAQEVVKEPELTHAVSTCANLHDEQRSETFKWPDFRQKITLNDQCWVSIDSLQERVEEVSFVDVRGKKETQRYPLKEVLVLPLHAIENDPGLKGQSIVLVGTGFDQISLDQACMRLRQNGSDVMVLSGGARALAGTVRGANSGIDHARITPKEFATGSTTIPWELVTFGLTDAQIAHLPQEPLTKELNQGQSNGMFRPQANLNIQYVLIASDERATYALQQSIGKTQVTNVVWLQGGFEAYENYIKEQHMIRINADRPLIRPCGGL